METASSGHPREELPPAHIPRIGSLECAFLSFRVCIPAPLLALSGGNVLPPPRGRAPSFVHRPGWLPHGVVGSGWN